MWQKSFSVFWTLDQLQVHQRFHFYRSLLQELAASDWPEAIGGECVFTSEWDSYAQKTYATNFPSSHAINGDITQIDAEDIPDHDVLLGGFPCQPFSIAGVSKKNALGRAHGFADETQGTLFLMWHASSRRSGPRPSCLRTSRTCNHMTKGEPST